MERVFEKKELCCGCSACKNVCPKGAISMGPDEKGFLYPEINQSLCIDCGLCKEVCPFPAGYVHPDVLPSPVVYAAKNRAEQVRMTSSSGGLFVPLSDIILSRGGVVYGARFDENHRVIHSRARTGEERDLFKSSKYVQSDLNGIFRDVAADLKDGKVVLFSGMPCQSAGLQSYLDKRKIGRECLVVCDFVCHGAPSPLIFEEYKAYMEKKTGSRIKDLTFRAKSTKKSTQDMRISFENGAAYQAPSAWEDPYYRMFLNNLILRPSCYQCTFTKTKRASDITLADFWGVEKAFPQFEDKKGVSLALLNTSKGKKLFEAVMPQLEVISPPLERCIEKNPNLRRPSSAKQPPEQFWNEYKEQGFDFVVQRYGRRTAKERVKALIYKTLENTGLLQYIKKG